MSGLLSDSVKQKLKNILHECVWRYPSLLCIDNLDSLVCNNLTEESSPSLLAQINALAFTFKYFYETVFELKSYCKVVTITTCSDIYAMHKTIIGVLHQKNVIFENIINMTQYKEHLFTTVVEKCSEQWTEADILDSQDRNDVLNWLGCESRISNRWYGLDAIALMKHAWTSASERNNSFSKSTVIERNDFQNAFDKILLTNTKKTIQTKLHFVDLYGLADVKKQLTEMFIWPSLYPKLFKKSPIKLQQGLLLYGLPGCGKSHLALALSNEVKMNFIMVKGPELLSKYIGASEERVRHLFNEARKTQPTLIFFDEFDSLAPRRGHDSTGVTDRVVNQLLTEIDGVSGLNNAGVFILAASNRPDLIDPAILRPGRISGRGYCRQPHNINERLSVLEFLLRRSGIALATESFTILDYLNEKKVDSRWLDFYTYADLVGIVNVTENNAVIRYNDTADASSCALNLHDFQSAISKSRASLNEVQIRDYYNA